MFALVDLSLSSAQPRNNQNRKINRIKYKKKIQDRYYLEIEFVSSQKRTERKVVSN